MVTLVYFLTQKIWRTTIGRVRLTSQKKEEFTDAIRTYGVHSGRKLKIFRNYKIRIYVKCLGAKGKCKSYAYYKATQSNWQLRKIIHKHTCSREFNVWLMTSKWLSGRLEKTLRENPNVKLTDLKKKDRQEIEHWCF